VGPHLAVLGQFLQEVKAQFVKWRVGTIFCSCVVFVEGVLVPQVFFVRDQISPTIVLLEYDQKGLAKIEV
jgi:hypothetical protein